MKDKNSMNSLSGKNNLGRKSGVSSSLASSTIFYKLRDLDRKITELDQYLSCYYNSTFYKKTYNKKLEQRAKLGNKRMLIRNKRKGIL